MTPFKDLPAEAFDTLNSPTIDIGRVRHQLFVKTDDLGFRMAQFKSFVSEYFGMEYELTAEIEHVLEYFFMDFPTSPKPGFILHGPTGTGKTLLIKAMFSLARTHLGATAPSFIPVYKIISEFRQTGEPALETIKNSKKLIIDDLGTEEIINSFGTKRNLLAEIIYDRYDKAEKYRTFFTTNLTLKELKSFYGNRIFSRLMEMAEWDATTLTGNDRRLNGCTKLDPSRDIHLHQLFNNQNNRL